MAQIRVLVADDHELVRCGIVRMLSDIDTIEVVGEASSGEDVLAFCRQALSDQELSGERGVDIVLMDIRMPGLGGLEATRRLTARYPEVKVVALSSFDDRVYTRKILEAGARGYLSKGSATSEILRCLQTVAAGKRYLSADIASALAIESLNPSDENPFSRLSPQEFQVANMVMDCYKVSDIAQALAIEPKTVNSYRYRIFEKLGVKSDVAMTRLAIQHGVIEVGCVLQI